jgi:exonuclease SbcC
MAGLRSYRTERTVDFTDLSLVAIIGPTGAGKSSVLEGITYALYGASTWDQRAVKELISDAAPSMRVSLTFEADGELWQVTRMISKKTAASHELICLSDPNVAKVDGDRQVNPRIEELIGLDYDGFCSCVLLPQGKFEQLLKATKKDRAAILKGILRLDELDLIRERANELTRQLTPRCEEIQSARAQFLPDPASTQAAAASRQQELEPRREALTQAKATVDTLIEQVAEHNQIARESDASARRIDEQLDPELLERLRALQALEGELASQHVTASRNVKQATEDAAAAERIVAGLRAQSSDSVAITNATTVFTSAREDLTAITEEELQLTQDQRQLTADGEAHTAETARLPSLATAVSGRDQALTDRQRSLTACEQSCDGVIGQLKATVDARGAIQTAREEELAALAKHATQLEASKTAAEKLAQAELAATEARAELDARQRDDLVAQLAHNCNGGDPCPVCSRPLPVNFVAPILPDDVRLLTDALADACAGEQAARRTASTEEGLLVTTEQALKSTQKQLADSLAIWEAQLAVVLPEGLQAETVELDDTTIERLRTPQRTANEQVEAARHNLDNARNDYTRLQASCDTTSSALKRRAEVVAATAEGLERRRALVRGRLAQLPEWIELRETRDEAAFEAAALTLATRLAEAHQYEQTAASAEGALVVAQEKLRAIETQIREQIRDPMGAERTALANLVGELARHRVELPAAPAPTASVIELSTWAEAVLDMGARELRRLRELAESETSAATTKTERGREAVAALGFENSRELQQALIEITADEIAATRERDRAAGQIESTQQLDTLLAKARGLRDGLSELARQLADAKFVGFVVERRQRALLTAASGILAQMTGAQFGFTEDFQIIDRRSDMARSPDTLSGGETFLASLALALGLVELAGRSGGRLQALFLDEGFGSLDPDALEQALNELEQRARAGRLIALISHVPAVAERIDQILQVTKTPQGSEIHLLDDAERQRLLLEDATEAAAAVR